MLRMYAGQALASLSVLEFPKGKCLRSNADATPFLARGVLPVDHLIPHRALRAYAGQAAAAPNDGFEVAPAAAACGFFANKLAGEVTEDNFSEILSNIV